MQSDSVAVMQVPCRQQAPVKLGQQVRINGVGDPAVNDPSIWYGEFPQMVPPLMVGLLLSEL